MNRMGYGRDTLYGYPSSSVKLVTWAMILVGIPFMGIRPYYDLQLTVTRDARKGFGY